MTARTAHKAAHGYSSSIVMAVLICATVLVSAPSTRGADRAAAQSSLGCHAPYRFPGAGPGDVYDAVQVTRRSDMSCSSALDLAAKSYALPHLRLERGPQFGAGGFGGPFRVGSFHCFLHSRGSDFINAACRSGHRYARFSDHRQYFSIPEAGWAPPAHKP